MEVFTGEMRRCLRFALKYFRKQNVCVGSGGRNKMNKMSVNFEAG